MNASPVRPILAITMGDPAGIGSEIAVRALAHQEVYDLCKPLVVGDKSCIEDAMRMVDSELKLHVVTDPADGKYELGTIDMIDLDNIKPGELQYKTCTAPQGQGLRTNTSPRPSNWPWPTRSTAPSPARSTRNR